MRFTVTAYITIEATSPEAALLWAEDVFNQLARKQEAIESIGQIEIEREDVDADAD